MNAVTTTNDARRMLAKHFKVQNFNVVSVADVKKFFIQVEINGNVKHWELKTSLPQKIN
ncbi:MAG: hypothetical protein QM490_05345 [Candidatus Gracilibacteria bacterium]